MKKDNQYYVYMLVDPRTQKPFYVGKGRDQRKMLHLKEARGSREKWVNSLKCGIINNIESCNRQIIFQDVATNLSEWEAYSLEQQLIMHYGKLIDGTGILTNIADGGAGGTGCNTVSVQSYTVSGAIVKTYTSLDAAAEDVGVHKSTICAALRGRSGLAGGFRWAYFGDPLIYFPTRTGVPVDQYTIDGCFVASFDTIQQAAKQVGVVFTAIVDCCRGTGNQRTAGGYRWSYFQELPIPLPSTYTYRPKGRVLQALDQNDQIIHCYASVKEAVANTTANSTGVSDCCAGRKKTSGGYKWRWVV